MSKIETFNLDKIEKITFKYPELFNTEAESLIRDLHKEILDTKEKIYSRRSEILDLEKELEILNNKFSDIKQFLNIEYEKEYSEIISNSTSLVIKGCDNTRY